MKFRRQKLFRSSIPLLIPAVAALLMASTPASMPRHIDERLWSEKDYVQGEDGAPRLLLVYPEPDTKLPYNENLTRYAGRVDPPDATVYIDDAKITIYPGGVFTGLLSIPEGSRRVSFSARDGSRKISIARTVRRDGPPSRLAHRPLRFGSLSPSGRQPYLLREGSSFNVAVDASPGNLMRVRIGASGDWRSMTESPPGSYRASLIVDESVSSRVPQAVQFQLRPAGRGADVDQPLSMNSPIQVRRLEGEEHLQAVVTSDLGTFLKEPQGWERWGNWIRGTSFPAVEQYGDRLKVDFGRGAKGFIETENARLTPEWMPVTLPDLGAPTVRFHGDPDIDRVTIDWSVNAPVGAVFKTPGGPAGRELRIELTGAAASGAGAFRPPGNDRSAIDRVEIYGGGQASAPEVGVTLDAGSLWGYGFSTPDPGTLRLTVRTRPHPGAATSPAPLRGLRVVVDAGHGGTDLGALGPSGLAEADVNLVLAALLGDRLESLGADVDQLRVDDRYVALDDRVDETLKIDPDLFISVHHNSVGFDTNPMADRGPKVFYHYPHSIPLAARVSDRLTRLLEPGESPQVLQNTFRVNRNISPCPSILIEGGFVCNPYDEVRLRDQETLRKMANAIAAGVVDTIQTN